MVRSNKRIQGDALTRAPSTNRYVPNVVARVYQPTGERDA